MGFGTGRTGFTYKYTPPKQSSGGGGLFGSVLNSPVAGLFGNLLDDTKALVGLPVGLVMTAQGLVTDPFDTLVKMGEGAWDTWSPLFHGEFGKWAKQTYDHPLAPILDIAAVLTLGAGAGATAATRAATAASAAGRTTGRLTKALDATGKTVREVSGGHSKVGLAAPTHYKSYSANPLVRARQRGAENAVNHLAAFSPKWFQPDAAVAERLGVSGLNAMTRAERGDAYRWARKDRYSAAERAHTARAAQGLSMGAILGAAKRTKETPGAVAREVIPHTYQNFRNFAFRVPGEAFGPATVTRPMTRAERKAAEKQAKREFDLQEAAGVRQRPPSSEPGLEKYDPRTAAGNEYIRDWGEQGPGRAVEKYDPDFAARQAESQQTIDSYGWAEDDVTVNRSRRQREKDGKLADQYFYIHKDAEANLDSALIGADRWAPEDIANFLSPADDKYAGFAKTVTTKDITKAMRDEDGNYLVVRNGAFQPYLQEGANSAHMMATLGRMGTRAWKYMVLGLRPGFFVNNAVGNYLMYMMMSGPHSIRGAVDAFRQLYPQDDVLRGVRGLGRTEHTFARSHVGYLGKHSTDWVEEWFLGAHRGFARDAGDMLAGETVRLPMGELSGKAAKFKRILGSGLYDLTHMVTDKQVRRMAINVEARKLPEVKALMKKGMHFDDAALAVFRERADLRALISDRVNDYLGQYHYLNPAERAVRAVIPFYTWDRAIARHGGTLLLERPTTARAITAMGQSGVETTEEILGEIPDFLRGALPLSLLGMPAQTLDGRIPILNTHGMNPYATLEPLIQGAEALVTGEGKAQALANLGAHPLITAAYEQMTGQSALSGARLPKSVTEGGILPGMVSGILKGLPQTRVLDSIGKDVSPETLYRGDFGEQFLGYLGVPIRNLNPDVSAELAKKRR